MHELLHVPSTTTCYAHAATHATCAAHFDVLHTRYMQLEMSTTTCYAHAATHATRAAHNNVLRTRCNSCSTVLPFQSQGWSWEGPRGSAQLVQGEARARVFATQFI